MKKFMDEDFLLTSDAAKKLYHDYAENMPIVDYHCHINRRFVKIESLKISHRYGSEEITTSGVRCVPMV